MNPLHSGVLTNPGGPLLPGPLRRDIPRFLAIIPLYRMRPDESPTFRALQAAVSELQPEAGSLRILLYDNTPEEKTQSLSHLPGYVEYYAARRNDGLAAAFNCAIDLAQQEGCDWIITLDQDTVLPPSFLRRIATIARDFTDEPAIASIVPQVLEDGRMLSPNWFWAGVVPRWFPRGYVGISPHPTFAFNSASTLRVSALRQIGGYSQRFWLDNCDSYIYHRLHLYGKKVFVAGDIHVEHEFSMLDRKNRMSIARYRNVLMAESAFWDMSMNRLAGLERTARLIGRWIRHLTRRDPRALRKETAFAIRRRLMKSRKSRLRMWTEESRKQEGYPAAVEDGQPTTPLKVSVCMATFNGEKFVRQQLRSILDQLGRADEVIVVDDASQDRTRELIAEFGDDRVRVVPHTQRQGVVRSFEDAVRNASGDLLFLCDQDDVWAPGKVCKVVNVFSQHPDVSVVVTGLTTIDENGASLKHYTRPFNPGFVANVISNRFQGSTMALRSTFIPDILPFPRARHVFHDAWIGLRAAATARKCYYLDEALLLYRRHASNSSGRLNLVQKILKRSRLLIALAGRGGRDWCAGRMDRRVDLR
jgi:glycosyltransferase involved in cell wall biosynthesis